MKSLSRGLPAVVLALFATLAVAPAAFALEVTIRIEGYSKTLLPEPRVTLDSAQVPGVASNCPGNTVAGAIEKGTKGNWDHQSGVQTILGETHDFSKTYWSGWAGGKYSAGICDQVVNEGEEVVMIATEFVANENYRPRDWPLTLHDVPARVARGEAFTVRVTEQVSDWQNTTTYGVGSGSPQPAADVAVTIGAQTVRTGSDGRAVVRLDQTGQLSAQAHGDWRSGRSGR